MSDTLSKKTEQGGGRGGLKGTEGDKSISWKTIPHLKASKAAVTFPTLHVLTPVHSTAAVKPLHRNTVCNALVDFNVQGTTRESRQFESNHDISKTTEPHV